MMPVPLAATKARGARPGGWTLAESLRFRR